MVLCVLALDVEGTCIDVFVSRPLCIREREGEELGEGAVKHISYGFFFLSLTYDPEPAKGLSPTPLF